MITISSQVRVKFGWALAQVDSVESSKEKLFDSRSGEENVKVVDVIFARETVCSAFPATTFWSLQCVQIESSDATTDEPATVSHMEDNRKVVQLLLKGRHDRENNFFVAAHVGAAVEWS